MKLKFLKWFDGCGLIQNKFDDLISEANEWQAALEVFRTSVADVMMFNAVIKACGSPLGAEAVRDRRRGGGEPSVYSSFWKTR